MKKFLPIGLIIIVVLVFFWQFLFKGLLPIPSDTIVGLYYPFREVYFKTNPNGLPYKNFLITDSVRQQYPWKNLALEAEKQFSLPIWNPYNFAGTPLLANFQSGVFYPFNLFFLVLPFSSAWSVIIFLQPLLAGLFLFLYLSNLKLSKVASFLGAISFSFCGFSIAWMEWGTILSTALWLPLILLSIDKIFSPYQISNIKFTIKNLLWPLVFILSLVFSFFAGHLQTFSYLTVLSFLYFLARWFQYGRKLKLLGMFVIFSFLSLILTIVQWLPTLNFILLSARNVDLPGFTQPGWFIPWQNLIQFLAPDFFGNPATLNYYGVWNYAELIGYIGIFPFIIAFFALFFRRDAKTLFFGAVFFLSLIFSLPTIFAQLPFILNLPFISTSQPTRLLFITDFSLSILAALGLDYFLLLKNKKSILYIFGGFSVLFAFIWVFVLFFHGNLITTENLRVARQNLIFPTVIFVASFLVICVSLFSNEKKVPRLLMLMSCILILITVFDLFRFGWKFEPFTNKNYLFPSTSVISYLQNQNPKEPFRVMSTDSKIFPPNFSAIYGIQTLDGYDPLYLQRYGELMVAVGRNSPNINPPFGFNRIITPQNFSSRIIALLNVKYVLSLEEIKNTNLNQVFTDGTIRVYVSKLALPRAFFVFNTLIVSSKQRAISAMFDLNNSLDSKAIVENVSQEDKSNFLPNWSKGEVQFTDYEANRVVLKTQSQGTGFLVLTDSYYPTWHATIDGKETKIYLTDFNFRGIIVPKGEHTIEFYDTLF